VKPFRVRGGLAVAELDHDERTVVARIVADVGLLLGGEVFGMERAPWETETPRDLLEYLTNFEAHLSEPDDPAILRLLPNAAPTDREVSDEFRRYTEPDLRTLKVARLRRIWSQLSEDGPTWEVAEDEAMDTAAALTDVRLVLASRLGVVTDEGAERLHVEVALAQRADDGGVVGMTLERERVWLGMLYEALTWLQDSLVAFVMGEEADDE
jgi:hypothetical protein